LERFALQPIKEDTSNLQSTVVIESTFGVYDESDCPK
jgi:hypothetical protein